MWCGPILLYQSANGSAYLCGRLCGFPGDVHEYVIDTLMHTWFTISGGTQTVNIFERRATTDVVDGGVGEVGGGR